MAIKIPEDLIPGQWYRVTFQKGKRVLVAEFEVYDTQSEEDYVYFRNLDQKGYPMPHRVHEIDWLDVKSISKAKEEEIVLVSTKNDNWLLSP